MTADQLDALRKALLSDVKDAYAGDPDRRHMLGGSRFQTDVNARYEAAGVLLDSDRPKSPAGGLGRYGAAAMLAEVGSASRSGSEAGRAVGDVAERLNKALTTAGQGFVKAGQSALGLFLSPFGKAGSGIGSIVGTLAGGLLGILGSGASLVATGLKLGGSLAGGIVGGVAGVLGTGLGAALGGIFGGAPGAIAGGLLGGGLVAGLTGLVSAAVGGISSSLGSILGAVGRAVGDLGNSIAGTLGNVKGVLSDLISTGHEWASATASLSRNGGLSLGQAGVASSFANILTGSPNGLAGLYNDFGHRSEYVGSVAKGFGVGGVNGGNPLSLVTGAYSRYDALGRQGGPLAGVNQQVLLRGLFGGSADAIGTLFSAGADTLRMVMRTAQATAMTPTQTRQSLVLNFQLNAVQAQLDSLKLKFLTDLMPAIQTGLKVVTTLLNANEGKLLAGFARVGEFLVVKLPTYLETGLSALYRFGLNFAQTLPKIFDAGLKVALAALQTVQGISREIGGNVLLRRFSPTLAAGLTDFGNLSPVKMGLTTEAGQAQLTIADRRRAQAAELQGQIFSREEGLRNGTSTESSDPAKALADIAKQKEAVKRLNAEADAADAEARRLNPLSVRVGAFSAELAGSLRNQRDATLPAVGNAFGTEQTRQGYWDHMQSAIEKGVEKGTKAGLSGSSVAVRSEVSISPTEHFTAEVAETSARMHLMALQEASSR